MSDRTRELLKLIAERAPSLEYSCGVALAELDQPGQGTGRRLTWIWQKAARLPIWQPDERRMLLDAWPGSRARTAHLNVKLTDEEHQAVCDAAVEASLSVSAYVRRRLGLDAPP